MPSKTMVRLDSGVLLTHPIINLIQPMNRHHPEIKRFIATPMRLVAMPLCGTSFKANEVNKN